MNRTSTIYAKGAAMEQTKAASDCNCTCVGQKMPSTNLWERFTQYMMEWTDFDTLPCPACTAPDECAGGGHTTLGR